MLFEPIVQQQQWATGARPSFYYVHKFRFRAPIVFSLSAVIQNWLISFSKMKKRNVDAAMNISQNLIVDGWVGVFSRPSRNA